METKYGFLRIAAPIFRVIGWIVLVLGIIVSIVLSFFLGTELPAFGVIYAILGIVFSVLVWASLLAFTEILYLLIDLEQNTRETADRLRIGSTDRPT